MKFEVVNRTALARANVVGDNTIAGIVATHCYQKHHTNRGDPDYVVPVPKCLVVIAQKQATAQEALYNDIMFVKETYGIEEIHVLQATEGISSDVLEFTDNF